MENASAILQTHQLSIGYHPGSKQEKSLARQLNLAIYPGELICLLGPNGSGKSTLIRSLAGLQPLLEGRVEMEGQLIHQLKPLALARKLSLVLTERVRTGNLNVYSLVALGRYPYTSWLGNLSKKDKEMIHTALEVTGISAFVGKKVNELSDGECQKVMLARALAQDTPLIILDEPTAHLDLPNRVSLMRQLHRLARETNKGILLSTHELDLALQAADQVWLLQANGKLTTGVPEDLVLEGSFEAAFDKEGFQFDKATGTFSIHQGLGQAIRLLGQGAPLFWTRRALQREGFAVVQHSSAFCTVELAAQDSGWKWIIHQKEKREEYSSIYRLLQALRKWKDSATKHQKKAIFQ